MLNKLEQFIFYLLIISIPFTTRKILYYPGFFFNEWLSVSLYATDILIVALLVLWLFNAVRASKFSIFNFQFSSKLKTYDYFLLGFLVIAAISIKNSTAQYLSYFYLIKLIEFILFYFYVRFRALPRLGIDKVFIAFFAGGLFQAIIAIAQFLSQSEVGLYFLGESIIGPDMKGVAVFLLENGERIMRAYGTTPHPNILAAYLLLSLFSVYILWSRFKGNRLQLSVGYIIILSAFLFTFSRVVIFAWAVTLISSLFLFKDAMKKIFLITIIVLIIFTLFYWPEILARLTISSHDEAVQLRVYYAGESLKSGFNFFGIGLGNFTSWLIDNSGISNRYLYQPVHNIYLLIYSEVGILGIIIFITLLTSAIRIFTNDIGFQSITRYYLFLSFFTVLFIGFFDHFLWTLQQGRLILWLTLGLLTFRISGDITKS